MSILYNNKITSLIITLAFACNLSLWAENILHSVNFNGEIVKYQLDEIRYFTLSDEIVTVSFKNGHTVRLKESISSISEKVKMQFVQINRGTIINPDYVERIVQTGKKHSLIFSESEIFAISRRNSVSMLNRFNDMNISSASSFFLKKNGLRIGMLMGISFFVLKAQAEITGDSNEEPELNDSIMFISCPRVFVMNHKSNLTKILNNLNYDIGKSPSSFNDALTDLISAYFDWLTDPHLKRQNFQNLNDTDILVLYNLLCSILSESKTAYDLSDCLYKPEACQGGVLGRLIGCNGPDLFSSCYENCTECNSGDYKLIGLLLLVAIGVWCNWAIDYLIKNC